MAGKRVSTKLPVVLVGGWGLPVSLVEPLLHGSGREVLPLTLDAHVQTGTLSGWLCHQLARVPQRSLWVGWSLGGMLAMEAANTYQERVAGVATLCSSPLFVADGDWESGLAREMLARFRRDLQYTPQRQWQRFLRLQIHGDHHERLARRALSAVLALGPAAGADWLALTLSWLEQMDQRKLWRQCQVPRLHLWGAQDQVCLWRGTDQTLMPQEASGQVVEGMAHWPGGPHLEHNRSLLKAWLDSMP